MGPLADRTIDGNPNRLGPDDAFRNKALDGFAGNRTQEEQRTHASRVGQGCASAFVLNQCAQKLRKINDVQAMLEKWGAAN